MKKILVGAVVGALALVGLVAAPAHAVDDWSTLQSSLSAPGDHIVLYEGTLHIVANSTGDVPIVVNGNKTLELPYEFSIDSSALAAPTFFISSGASLTVTSVQGLTVSSQAGYTVFGGDGSVAVGDSTSPGKIIAGNNTLFSNTGGTTINSSGTVTLGSIGLGAGSSHIDNYGDIESTSFTAPPDMNNYGTVNSTGDFSVPFNSYYGNNATTAKTTVTGAFSVDSTGRVNNQGSITCNIFHNSGQIDVTGTGSLTATINSTNGGTLTVDGSVSVGALNTIDNTGIIFPLTSTSLTGTVLHNNYTISYTTTGSEAAIPAVTIYAPTFADNLARIPWPTDTTGTFLGWKIGTTILSDTTDLSTYATSGGTTAVTQENGTFNTATPKTGDPYTGLTGTIGGSATFTYKVDGSIAQSSSSATYTPLDADVTKDLSVTVQVSMPSGYTPSTNTYESDFGAIQGELRQIGTNTATMSGLAAVGNTLIGDASNTYRPTPNFTYVWYQDAVFGPQVGTGLTYVPTAADVGHMMVFAAFGTLPDYDSVVTAAYSAQVEDQPTLALGSTIVNAGDTVSISVPDVEEASDYTAELHSSPVFLGSFHSSAVSLLSGSVVIPANTPTGFHTIVILDAHGNVVTSAVIFVNGVGLASTGAAVTAAPVLAGWLLGLGLLLVVIGVKRRRA